jgi:hypothetical protein
MKPAQRHKFKTELVTPLPIGEALPHGAEDWQKRRGRQTGTGARTPSVQRG